MTDPTGALSGSAPVGTDPIEEIAAAVRACPAVADLDGGPFGTVASYLPGRQVPGIRIAPGGPVEVHVAGRYPQPVAVIARQVRVAVRSVLPGAEVVVTIEDYR